MEERDELGGRGSGRDGRRREGPWEDGAAADSAM